MLCYVRDVTNNIMSHLIFYLEAKKSLLTQFVREYWDAAKRGSEINWRQAPTSSHVFLGLFYLLMSHVIMSVSKCFKFDKPTIIVYLRTQKSYIKALQAETYPDFLDFNRRLTQTQWRLKAQNKLANPDQPNQILTPIFAHACKCWLNNSCLVITIYLHRFSIELFYVYKVSNFFREIFGHSCQKLIKVNYGIFYRIFT